MGEFLHFRKMITPTIITVVFWILVGIIVIAGLIALFAGNTGSDRFGGFLLLILGPLFVRVYCEILIVIFKMHEALRAIEANTRGTAPTTQTVPLLPQS